MRRGTRAWVPAVVRAGASNARASIRSDRLEATTGLGHSLAAGGLERNTVGGAAPRVQILKGWSFNQAQSHPLAGLDGVIGGSDAQFRIPFVATGLGSSMIRSGMHSPGDGVLVSGNPSGNTSR